MTGTIRPGTSRTRLFLLPLGGERHAIHPSRPQDTSLSDAYWIISEHLQAVHDRYQARSSRTPEALIPTMSRPLTRMRFNIRPHTTSKDPR